MKEKSRKTLTKSILFCTMALVLLATLAFVAFLNIGSFVIFDKSKLTLATHSTTFFDKNGKDVSNLATVSQKSSLAKIEELSEATKNAFVLLEDKRFYQHNGVDFKRIVGATVANIKSNRMKEGASTITQQLAKNTFLSHEKTYKRKIAEIQLAKKIERNFTKNQILELYLNTIYFGNGSFGIQQASLNYFDKEAKNLSIGESAILAGLVKAPSRFSRDATACAKRKNIVLDLLKENKIISETDFEIAQTEDDSLSLSQKSRATHQNYFNATLEEVAQILGTTATKARNSNLKIETYFVEQKQQILEKSLLSDSSKNQNNTLAQKMSMLCDNQTGGVEAFFGVGTASLVSSKRQIGSTAKPFVALAPALELGNVSPATPVLDEATNFDGFAPSNLNEKYSGWTTVRQAISKSMNVPAVKLLNSCKPEFVRETLKKMGINIGLAEIQLPMALGSFEQGLTISQLAQAYMTFANEGIFRPVSFVRQIADENGNILYSRKNFQQTVFSKSTAFLCTDILKSVVETGTAKAMSKFPFDVAGKTGTVGKKGQKNNSDALFASYTTQNTLVVWFVQGENTLLSSKITGATAPVKVADNIFKQLYKTQIPQNFVRPFGVKEVALSAKALIDQNKLEHWSEGAKQIELFDIKFLSQIHQPKQKEKIEFFQKIDRRINEGFWGNFWKKLFNFS